MVTKTYENLVELTGTRSAPGVLDQLAKVPVSARIGIKIVKLMRKVQEVAGDLNQMTAKLREKYDFTDLCKEHNIDPRDGLPVDLLPREFLDEWNELMKTEVEIEVDPVELPPEVPGVTAEMLMALDGLVEVL